MKKLILVLALSGCATAPQNPIKAAWHLQDSTWEGARKTGINLKRPDGSIRHLSAYAINNVLTVRSKLQSVSGVTADLAIVETNTPNAFAANNKGRPVIALSLSYLDQLGGDLDAIAATVGHELAHLHLGHSGAARAAREDSARAASQVAGTIAGAFIPFGGLITSVGVTAYARSFTRDEERAADEQGLRWAIQAGFDPCGEVRVMQMYQRLGTAQIDFLSTHPGYQERAEFAEQYARKAGKEKCEL